ncbi:MAG: Asp23/Gls24 family envelope stress response protein [Anaerolineales bacterium]|nr:Asp23/Gls24 family envelope stress response protein [Anaerolineales bacterium]MCS7247144.1 Asp23/Gls24 family envelope stress response protein [Anaerolineales bacterium]MDW8160955.1 Asp23/Gls24 family envelope stress response protein [Anaerolineales bacterium]MDW8446701.1 Asp23/Gls24 family envelope stress response protein [Anaerolineales bacterium]
MCSDGKTTIAPEVLKSIARMSCLSVEGVSRMATSPAFLGRLISKKTQEGVEVEVEDDKVYINLYVVLKPSVNIREVSRNIQQQVYRAITDLVGMNVGKINVHVEDIDYSHPEG